MAESITVPISHIYPASSDLVNFYHDWDKALPTSDTSDDTLFYTLLLSQRKLLIMTITMKKKTLLGKLLQPGGTTPATKKPTVPSMGL